MPSSIDDQNALTGLLGKLFDETVSALSVVPQLPAPRSSLRMHATNHASAFQLLDGIRVTTRRVSPPRLVQRATPVIELGSGVAWGERHMRKVAILMTCLLMGTCAAEIAKTEPAAKEVPPKYRAQIIREMSQALDLSKVHDAGITPLVVRFVSLMSGTKEVVCVTTLKGANSAFTYKVYQETIFTFKDGQAERGSTNMLRGTGSVSRAKLT
jgi:hypothetical protein